MNHLCWNPNSECRFLVRILSLLLCFPTKLKTLSNDSELCMKSKSTHSLGKYYVYNRQADFSFDLLGQSRTDWIIISLNEWVWENWTHFHRSHFMLLTFLWEILSNDRLSESFIRWHHLLWPNRVVRNSQPQPTHTRICLKTWECQSV